MIEINTHQTELVLFWCFGGTNINLTVTKICCLFLGPLMYFVVTVTLWLGVINADLYLFPVISGVKLKLSY